MYSIIKKPKQEDKWKKVYINRDMTEAERSEAFEKHLNRNMSEAEKKESTELRKELRERRNQEVRENGTNRYAIQRGQIVRVEATGREPAENGTRGGEAQHGGT